MNNNSHQETNISSIRLAERETLAHFTRVARFFGFTVILFFGLAFFGASLRLPIPEYLDALLRWGPGGAEQYEQMIALINIVWGFFILRAAEDPVMNVVFFDFTAAGMIAHITLMTFMGIFNSKDRIHLIGDILFGWAAIGPFTYVWLQAKYRLGL